MLQNVIRFVSSRPFSNPPSTLFTAEPFVPHGLRLTAVDAPSHFVQKSCKKS